MSFTSTFSDTDALEDEITKLVLWQAHVVGAVSILNALMMRPHSGPITEADVMDVVGDVAKRFGAAPLSSPVLAEDLRVVAARATERVAALETALTAVIPYAESRAEDMSTDADGARENGAEHEAELRAAAERAWDAVIDAKKLLGIPHL